MRPLGEAVGYYEECVERQMGVGGGGGGEVEEEVVVAKRPFAVLSGPNPHDMTMGLRGGAREECHCRWGSGAGG